MLAERRFTADVGFRCRGVWTRVDGAMALANSQRAGTKSCELPLARIEPKLCSDDRLKTSTRMHEVFTLR